MLHLCVGNQQESNGNKNSEDDGDQTSTKPSKGKRQKTAENQTTLTQLARGETTSKSTCKEEIVSAFSC